MAVSCCPIRFCVRLICWEGWFILSFPFHQSLWTFDFFLHLLKLNPCVSSQLRVNWRPLTFPGVLTISTASSSRFNLECLFFKCLIYFNHFLHECSWSHSVGSFYWQMFLGYHRFELHIKLIKEPLWKLKPYLVSHKFMFRPGKACSTNTDAALKSSKLLDQLLLLETVYSYESVSNQAEMDREFCKGWFEFGWIGFVHSFSEINFKGVCTTHSTPFPHPPSIPAVLWCIYYWVYDNVLLAPVYYYCQPWDVNRNQVLN